MVQHIDDPRVFTEIVWGQAPGTLSLKDQLFDAYVHDILLTYIIADVVVNISEVFVAYIIPHR